MDKKPVVLFHPNLPKMSKNQTQVLDLLIEAGKLIVPIYLKQENHRFPGANFYPHGSTKKEIEKAAMKDPKILDPYTVVKRKNDKLIAVSYFEEYKDLLKKVSDKILEAAKVTDDKDFATCLRFQAKSLMDGSIDESTVSWMSVKPYIIDFVIGPIERYNDKLFFTKTSYQCWVGVLDLKATSRLRKYKDIILSSRRRVLIPSEKVDYYDKVQVRVDETLIFSGLIARTMFVGVNLPNDVSLMEKYGSEITIFKQTNAIRHQKNWAIFNKIFSSEFKKQFSEKDIEEGSLYSTALHELAHTYLRYRDSEIRLKDLFPIIDELGATVMGIKVCGSLLLKDIASTKQLESIMLAYMARSFNNVLLEAGNKSKLHYIIGGAIFLNYLLESGAVKEVGGVSWPNFMKMFVSLDELASILERLLSQGTRKDAEIFIKRYGDVEKLQRFKKASQ